MELHGVARNWAELCGIVRNCAELCGIVRNCTELCRIARNCAELRGIARNYAELRGIGKFLCFIFIVLFIIITSRCFQFFSVFPKRLSTTHSSRLWPKIFFSSKYILFDKKSKVLTKHHQIKRFELKKYLSSIYYIHIYTLAKAGQTAGSNWLTFFYEIQGYPWVTL